MILLHENDQHFNLIVLKNSHLAKHGSLSYRQKIISEATKEENDDNKEKKINNVKDN